ncbi:MAG: glycosyltransferase [Micromonosporaceae bacterium]
MGIFAHNEQATIRQVVEGFLAQKVSSAVLCEVVVICCGCTDETVPIVQEIAAQDPRVRLLVRSRREGKVAAINEFLGLAETDLLVLCSGDVVPANNAVELLVSPFVADDLCMMTGPRVLGAAKLSRRRAVDHLHDMLWSLHHAVSMRRPKLGELVAIRRDVLQHRLPAGIHCDEALIESIVVNLGGRLGYVPDALVYNFPPASVGELYRQRRRIAAQHKALKRLRGYSPSTAEFRLIVPALRTVPWSRLSHVLLLVALEAIARVHGHWDNRCGRSYRLWRVARPESRADHHVALDASTGALTFETTVRRNDHAEGLS